MRTPIVLSLVVLAACGGGTGSVTLTARPSSSSAALLTSKLTAGNGVSRVRLLINEAELRGGRGCHRTSFCMKGNRVEQGPFIATLDAKELEAGTVTEPVLMADVPAGTYRGSELELEPLGSDEHWRNRKPAPPPADEAFADFVKTGATIIIEGAWAGEAFTFSSAFRAEQETEGPLTVTAGQPLSLGLVVDASKWFTTAEGASLDPRQAANHDAITANIKSSLTIEDDDHRR